jgi:hypothetical protein
MGTEQQHKPELAGAPGPTLPIVPSVPEAIADAVPAGALAGAAAICRGVCRMLAELGYATLTEVTLATGRRVDVMALDRRGEILVVEIKSSVADFRADRKWQDYLEFCDRFAFAVGPAFPRELVPPEVGLMVADAYDAHILRASPTTLLSAARRKHLMLRFAHVASARLQRRDDPEL